MLSAKSYLKATSFIFCIVGFAHLIRLLLGLNLVVAGWNVPLWISIIGFLVPWYLSYNAYILSGKKSKK